ncbi:hypothetical protein C9975_03025 [Thalassospira xiamenensis]|nr:hypothetical protein C9975_03025 [Thalassospira xiamenensis]
MSLRQYAPTLNLLAGWYRLEGFVMSEYVSWSLQLAKAAPKGSQIRFFRTIGGIAEQQKVFFAENMVFIVKFRHGEFVEMISRQRRRNESLLGLEGSIEEQLRKEGLL